MSDAKKNLEAFERNSILNTAVAIGNRKIKNPVIDLELGRKCLGDQYAY